MAKNNLMPWLVVGGFGLLLLQRRIQVAAGGATGSNVAFMEDTLPQTFAPVEELSVYHPANQTPLLGMPDAVIEPAKYPLDALEVGPAPPLFYPGGYIFDIGLPRPKPTVLQHDHYLDE